jgi:hypothetical protein
MHFRQRLSESTFEAAIRPVTKPLCLGRKALRHNTATLHGNWLP